MAVAVVLRPALQGGSWILISHRLPDSRLPDLWEFPGGKLLPGEAGEACAVRETEEETGVVVAVRRRLMSRAYRGPDNEVDLEFYHCEYLGGVPEPRACQAVRWVRPENLGCYRFPLANDPILELLMRDARSDRNRSPRAPGPSGLPRIR